MKVTIDPVDDSGHVMVVLLDGNAWMSFRLNVEESDALAEALIAEGVAWRDREPMAGDGHP